MYSSICPIGAPSRNYTRDRNPTKKPAPPRARVLASPRSARPQGMVFSVDDLPQLLQSLQGAEQTSASRLPPPQSGDRRGMLFDVDNLPQELKNLQRDAPRNNTRQS
ncbi:uncharacterized protein VP01_2240g4 [Puccinia sorghi]|uniref:Uncharacterized protein n=1 Tax=Puccinia sorghi TaxID=27349 RepID=A0A0L6V8G6_9BASI|nr:uncharacterized protein VP01_2240g4 [Puccinia sorghi]